MAGRRLYTLDGIRGLAAICVVLFHLDRLGFVFVRSGYLAVDFFFVLSGLVVAIAYQDKLNQDSLGVARFLTLRFFRLYPLYIAGTLLALVALTYSHRTSIFFLSDKTAMYLHIVPSLLMLPDFWSRFDLYPINPPAWSLMFELLVNGLFSVLLVRLPVRWLTIVWLISFGLYAIKVQHAWARDHGANLDPYWDHLTAGMLRVTCSFTFGLLIMRLGSWRRRQTSSVALIPVLALTAVFFLPPTLVMDLLAVGLFIPATVWMASRTELPERFRSSCLWLGDISYPLYATHFPVLFLVDTAAKRLGTAPSIEAATFVAVALVTATSLVNFDKKAGKYLSGFFNSSVTRRCRMI